MRWDKFLQNVLKNPEKFIIEEGGWNSLFLQNCNDTEMSDEDSLDSSFESEELPSEDSSDSEVSLYEEESEPDSSEQDFED